MRRIRALIIVSAVGVATLGSVIFGTTPAKATVNGYGTCKVFLDNNVSGGSSHDPVECYW